MNGHFGRPHPYTRDPGTVSRLLVLLLGLFFVLFPGTGTVTSSVSHDAAVRGEISPAGSTQEEAGSREGTEPTAATAAVRHDETAGGYGPGAALVPADVGAPGPLRGPDRLRGASAFAAAGVALGLPCGRALPVFLS